jgi:hypothetical protein
MGYSRNYQKYWDEKKRKRDEEVSPGHDPLPLEASVNEESLSDVPDTQNKTEEESLDDEVFLDCCEFSSGEESSKSQNVDFDEMTTSSLGSSVVSESTNTNNDVYSDDSGGGYDTSMCFTSKTYKKTTVPMRESCSFELIRLLDKAGSPRYLYQEVKALLNKQCKNGFQISEAMSREVLMKSLYHQFPCPQVQRIQLRRL